MRLVWLHEQSVRRQTVCFKGTPRNLAVSMRYVALEARKLSIGSGQVESAVRRVINLRFKAPGSFWTATTVSGLMHLRAAFKAGRWDDVMIGVLTDAYQTPSFELVSTTATHRSAEAQERDTPQTSRESRKPAA